MARPEAAMTSYELYASDGPERESEPLPCILGPTVDAGFAQFVRRWLAMRFGLVLPHFGQSACFGLISKIAVRAQEI